MVDVATNVWPLQPGQLPWRYGAVGLASGFLLTPLMGLFIAAAVAVVVPHPRVLRLVGFICAAGAAAVILATLMFSLDAIQFRLQVPPEGQSSYRIGVARAWAKNVLVAVALIWLARGALRAQRALGTRR